MRKKKSSDLKAKVTTPSTKTVFLRVSPKLHAALMAAAGAEQERLGEKVSMTGLAARILAEAVGLDVDDE
jgi:predicted HicB family RNase H-like nuclease